MLGPIVLHPHNPTVYRSPEQVVADLRRERDAHPPGSFMHGERSERLAQVEAVFREAGRFP